MLEWDLVYEERVGMDGLHAMSRCSGKQTNKFYKRLKHTISSLLCAEYRLYRWNNMTLKERREKGLMAVNGMELIRLGNV